VIHPASTPPARPKDSYHGYRNPIRPLQFRSQYRVSDPHGRGTVFCSQRASEIARQRSDRSQIWLIYLLRIVGKLTCGLSCQLPSRANADHTCFVGTIAGALQAQTTGRATPHLVWKLQPRRINTNPAYTSSSGSVLQFLLLSKSNLESNLAIIWELDIS
jgi:hypothetical protein